MLRAAATRRSTQRQLLTRQCQLLDRRGLGHSGSAIAASALLDPPAHTTRARQSSTAATQSASVVSNPNSHLPAPVSVQMSLGRHKLTIETNRIGTLADGVVLARMGDTSVLVSAVCGWRPSETGDFLPLQVDYREKAFAGGVIPSTYSRREANASDRETLAARIIDRSLRPLFAKGFNYDTQIICSLTSFDKDADPGMLSIIAASAALHVSSVPWQAGPVGAVRVGWLNDEPVLAPSHEEEEASTLNLLYSGTDKKAVMMEVGAEELKEGDLIRAMRFAHAQMPPLIALQNDLRALAGKDKKPLPLSIVPDDILQAVHALIYEDAREMYRQHHFNKGERGNAQRLLFLKISEVLGPVIPSHQRRFLSAAGDTVMKSALRSLVVEAALKENTLDINALRSRHCHPILGTKTITTNEGPSQSSDATTVADTAASSIPHLPTGDAEVVEELAVEVQQKGVQGILLKEEAATTNGGSSNGAVAASTSTSLSSSGSGDPSPFSSWDAEDQPDYRLLDAPSCRPDGRSTTQIRPLRADVDVLPVVHGSAVFSRGNTQVLCTTTLGPLDQAQQMRLPGGGLSAPTSSSSSGSTAGGLSLPLTGNAVSNSGGGGGAAGTTTGAGSGGSSNAPANTLIASAATTAPQLQLKKKAFFLHYDFPPYSTNEVGRVGGANRRMIGHGALAERAMLAVLPDEFDFPYTIRVTSEVTGSDGSSSMATVCGASLALMDAGVPIKRPVAGISIGCYTPKEDYLKTTDEDQMQATMEEAGLASPSSSLQREKRDAIVTDAPTTTTAAVAEVPAAIVESANTTEPTSSENELLAAEAEVAVVQAAAPAPTNAAAPTPTPAATMAVTKEEGPKEKEKEKEKEKALLPLLPHQQLPLRRSYLLQSTTKTRHWH
jgi:polyribonucleotide nucleotidyltransferase